jgi:hypothetical protein
LNSTGFLQLVVDTDCIVDSVAECLKDLDTYSSWLRDSKCLEAVDCSRFYVGWGISNKKRADKNKQSRRV